MLDEEIFKANIELNEREIKEKKIALESKPRILMLMLTAKCNLRCIMCPKQESKDILSCEDFEKIVGCFPYLELINWGGGGEVFLASNFKKYFLKAALYQHIRHDITTNGLLIDEEWAEILVQNNVNLTYSIDSAKKETYENIRRGARFDDLIKSIGTINKYKQKYNSKIRLILNAVVMRCNYKEIYLLPDFCERHGFSQLRLEYLRPVVDPEQDIFTERKDSKAIEYLKNIMPDIENECKKFEIKLESCIRPFLYSSPNQADDSNCLVFNCRLPWKKLLIDGTAKGRIVPDCLCVHPLGNISDSTIEEAWNNEIMRSYRANILNKTAENWCSVKCATYERNG